MACHNMIKIEQLNSENYDCWKVQMEALLIKNDLWEYVSGDMKKPKEEAGTAYWKKHDRKAKADILLSVSSSLLKDVKDCATSMEVWMKLKQMYDSKGPARKATLLKKLILTKMKGDDDVVIHISNFFDIVNKLRSIDMEMDEDLLSVLLLYSLPEQFENFRVAMESRDELPKPAVLKVKIIEEYNARSMQQSLGSNSEVLLVNLPENKRNFSRNTHLDKTRGNRSNYRNKIICFTCKRVGHKSSQCRHRNQGKEKSSYAIESTFLVNKRDHDKKISKWILDSGATSHMCSDINKFIKLNKVDNEELRLANNKITKIKGKGNVRIESINGKVNLFDVLFVPDLRANLLSVNKITKNNHKVTFQKEEALILNNKNEVVLTAKKNNGLYEINENISAETYLINKNSELTLWHKRYGHLNLQTLQEMIKRNKILGINKKVLNGNKGFKCEICIQGKQTRLPFPKNSHKRCKKPLELIHSDVCGPMKTTSQGGARFFITFIDDATRWCEVYFMKHKNEALKMFKIFKAKVENFKGAKIKAIRTDNGTEYVNGEFAGYLQKFGIQHQLTTPYTPEQNGVSERMNRTLIEMARCMLLQSGLSFNLWAEAISTATYIRNRCASKSIENEIPYKLWKGTVPVVAHFRVFGSLVYVLEKGYRREKFNFKSKPHYFLGYCENSKAYRLWNKETKGIVRSRDVIFIDECEIGNEDSGIEILEEIVPEKEKEKCENNKVGQIADNEDAPDALFELKNEKFETEDVKSKREQTNDETGTKEEVENKRKPGRPRILRTGSRGRPKKIYSTGSKSEKQHRLEEAEENVDSSNDSPENHTTQENDLEQEVFLTFGDDPEDIQDVKRSPYRKDWEDAIKNELEAHEKNKTWTIVEKPKNKKIIGCRWVFTTKSNSESKLLKRKARLVAKGYSQRPGIDYSQTYAPVAKYRTIRIMIAIAVEWNLQLHQFDIVTAYLNGNLEEEIYMQLPPHYEEFKGIIGNNKICRLQKAIYGLKQSGRAWYLELTKQLHRMGFLQLKSESCLYVQTKENDIILLTIYVDDIIIATNNSNKIEWFKGEISKEFEIRDMGKLNQFLGIEFTHFKNGIILTQEKFIHKLLKKFGMEEANPTKTPLDSNIRISKELCPKTKDEQEEMKKIPYQNLIGSLLYLSLTTRPDISYAVNVLSQYNNSFGKSHWISAKRVLRYLKQTINHGLYYRKLSEDLEGYVDADWGSNLDDRRSYSGYFFKLAGSAISWEAKKQRTVALSTAEAEYMALVESTKEAMYLQHLLSEIKFRQDKAITLYNDNKSAHLIAENPIISNRSKHIDIRHHFIRDAVKNKDIQLKYLKTEDMLADVLTKSLPIQKFEACVRGLGIVNKELLLRGVC